MVAVLLPVFLVLGFWQLERAEEKRQLQREYDRRASAPTVEVAPDPQPVEALQFYRVRARGRYEPGYQVLLDNRVHQGRAGYHVITPLKIEGGEVRLLVNRGWVPLENDRRDLPPIPVPEGIQEITGIATVPAEKVFSLGDPTPISLRWPQVWQHMDMRRYASLVPFPLQPVVVLLDPKIPGGYVRAWQRLDSGIAVHQAYAVQWFALAAALLGGYLYFGLRRARTGSEEA
jgi:surfeit locus 1 family protein